MAILVEGPSRKNPARWEDPARGATKLLFLKDRTAISGPADGVEIKRTSSFTLYGDPAIINLD